MSKVNLPLIPGGYLSLGAMNSRFAAIEAAFDNTLSRDGSLPNSMEAELDMDGNNILNAKNIFAQEFIRNGVALVPNELVGLTDPVLGSVEIKIPTDYPTLQAAIDDWSWRPVSNGVVITLLIESGHTPQSGIVLTNGVYNQFIISAEDAVVNLPVDFASTGFITLENTIGPTLNCLVNANYNCDEGVNIQFRSSINVNPGAGVINTVVRGAYANQGSILNANGANFSGTNGRGLWVTRASVANCQDANFSGAGVDCATIRRGSIACLRDADCSNAGNNGLFAIRAWVDATWINVSGAGRAGIAASNGSQITANRANITNTGVYGVESRAGSIVDVQLADLPTGRGNLTLVVTGGGIIGCDDTTVGGLPLDFSHFSVNPNSVTGNGIIFAEGFPEGIQRVTGGDGEALLFSNGNMIAAHQISLTYGADRYLEGTWTFPQESTTTPRLQASIRDLDPPGDAEWARIGATRIMSITSSSAIIRVYRIEGQADFGAGDTIAAQVFMFGRWL